jgi:hypothetical protein
MSILCVDQLYKLYCYLLPVSLLFIRFRSIDLAVILELAEPKKEEKDPIDWQQFQTLIWLKKCRENPELYIPDIDYSYQRSETRRYRRKRKEEHD